MKRFFFLFLVFILVSCSSEGSKRLTPVAEETPDDAVADNDVSEIQDSEQAEPTENVSDDTENPIVDDDDPALPADEDPSGNDIENPISDEDPVEIQDEEYPVCGDDLDLASDCSASYCETVADCCNSDLCVTADACGGRKVCRSAFFKENFDSYVAGNFPNEGPWTLKYAGSSKSYQMVTSERYVSAENSMHLLGSKKYNNSAIMTAVLPEVPNVINVEMKMNTQGDNVYFALCTFNGSGQWGNYDMKVEFADGKIRYQIPEWSAYEIAPSYEPNEWYKIRLKLDQVNKTVSVWVNDELKVDNQIHNFDSLPIPNICLSSDKNDKKVWFDDIFVWAE
jgi:hypothetical protein